MVGSDINYCPKTLFSDSDRSRCRTGVAQSKTHFEMTATLRRIRQNGSPWHGVMALAHNTTANRNLRNEGWFETTPLKQGFIQRDFKGHVYLTTTQLIEFRCTALHWLNNSSARVFRTNFRRIPDKILQGLILNIFRSKWLETSRIRTYFKKISHTAYLEPIFWRI